MIKEKNEIYELVKDSTRSTTIRSNNFVEFELDNDILIAKYKASIITKEIAIEVVKLRKEVSNNLSLRSVIYANSVSKIEKTARDYFTSPIGISGVTAAAIIINSNFQAVLLNFFLLVSNPQIPNKVFTDESKAKAWIKQF